MFFLLDIFSRDKSLVASLDNPFLSRWELNRNDLDADGGSDIYPQEAQQAPSSGVIHKTELATANENKR